MDKRILKHKTNIDDSLIIDNTIVNNPFDDITGMYMWNDKRYVYLEVTFKR
jgi:hypothetical protein